MDTIETSPREDSTASSTRYYAHSENVARVWHPLHEHLRCVAALAEAYAGDRPWAEEARLAGLLHDLGKYGDRFQARLRGKDQGLDHWSQGAYLALTKHRAIAAALAIQGHHVGLQRATVDALRHLDPKALIQHHPFALDLSDPDPARLMQRAEADGLLFLTPARTALSLQAGMAHPIAAMLDVRLLFSCLVDADFLDTEAHFEGNADGKRYRTPGPILDASAASAALDEHMRNRIRPASHADGNVREVREMLWQAVSCAAQNGLGLFTLTAPTGSGKTLAMLKFALDHAARHGLKRVVVVMPFLTIIEQTARVYRMVFSGFPENFVLEHHSLGGLGTEEARCDAEEDARQPAERERRLLSENWDAPIILTTNVQLLESLFSNRPSACRKLHSLMNAVILFDEAQSLPQHLAVSTLAALSHLCTAYHSTVLFATATQPAFDALDDAVKKHAVSGWRPTEAVPGHPALFAELKRVTVRWPKRGDKLGWPKLADALRGTRQALCVVNLKRHARELLEMLAGEEGVFHLSTNLCAGHRRIVLDEVRARLERKERCRLISTQCVEAGVDIDFPTVFRALAPLEAIAQAAGRCNREGRMAESGMLGEVVVFEPDDEGDPRRRYPTYAYFQATEVTRTMLIEAGDLDINDPSVFRNYYRRLYDVNRPASQNADLNRAIREKDFVEIAKLYRLIDQAAIQVLVPWAGRMGRFEELKRNANLQGISGEWMRRAQNLAVGIYRPKDTHPAWSVLIPAKIKPKGKQHQGRPPVSDEWFILEDPRAEFYDDVLGLKLPDSDRVFIA